MRELEMQYLDREYAPLRVLATDRIAPNVEMVSFQFRHDRHRALARVEHVRCQQAPGRLLRGCGLGRLCWRLRHRRGASRSDLGAGRIKWWLSVVTRERSAVPAMENR